MRLRPSLLLLGALIFAAGTARAVDRGQFQDVPNDIRAWFKGVRSPDGVPCRDISDGQRTIHDVRAGGYWVPIDGVWWQVPERAVIRNAGNPLGEAVLLVCQPPRQYRHPLLRAGRCELDSMRNGGESLLRREIDRRACRNLDYRSRSGLWD